MLETAKTRLDAVLSAETRNAMNSGIKVIALIGSIAAVALFLQVEDHSKALRIENSFIAHQKFAVVDAVASGSHLYFGNTDGTGILRIVSPYHLSDPFIDQSGRLIFVERNEIQKTEFRLLALEQRERHTTCQILLQSDKYIGSPFVPTGSLSG